MQPTESKEDGSAKAVESSPKVVRTPDAMVGLDNFIDFLDADEKIPDITKSDKSPRKANAKEGNQERNEPSDAVSELERSDLENQELDDSQTILATTEAPSTTKAQKTTATISRHRPTVKGIPTKVLTTTPTTPSTKSHHRPTVKVVPTEASKRTTPSTTPSPRPTLKTIPTEASTATSTVPSTKSHHRSAVKAVSTEASPTKRTTPSTKFQHRPTLKAISTEASTATPTVPSTKSYHRPTIKAIFTESFATTRPIQSTTEDTFAEFNDRSLFRDISFFDGQEEQSQEKIEKVAQKIHPPIDDFHGEILDVRCWSNRKEENFSVYCGSEISFAIITGTPNE
ncbi:hypothetical protein TELCIR_06309 [Teladorsagia circumcincta]|uniref:Uncharacterized protein n=1 Tax=Teladorsagia circumcincta TaxID=45464 RepID=A0A2G9UNQ5_TELCI|nr:hypothetical protein TELCIR_06309 [Teladorsagia circumcincta]